MTQPGWHPDPLGDARRERYFDGATWTSRTRPRQAPDSSAAPRGGRLAAVLAGAVGLGVVAVGVWGVGTPALLNPPVTVAPPSLAPATVEPPPVDCVADNPARLPGLQPDEHGAWLAIGTRIAPRPGEDWAGPAAVAYPFARAAGVFSDEGPAGFPLAASRALLIAGELDHRSSQGWHQTVAEQLIACVVPRGYHVNNSTVTSTTNELGPFEVDARISRVGQDNRPAMLAKVVLVGQGEGNDRRYGFLLWRAPAGAAAELRALRLAEDRFVGR